MPVTTDRQEVPSRFVQLRDLQAVDVGGPDVEQPGLQGRCDLGVDLAPLGPGEGWADAADEQLEELSFEIVDPVRIGPADGEDRIGVAERADRFHHHAGHHRPIGFGDQQRPRPELGAVSQLDAIRIPAEHITDRDGRAQRRFVQSLVISVGTVPPWTNRTICSSVS